MAVRTSVSALGLAVLVAAGSLVAMVASPVAGATWTSPQRIPGTVGLANPLGATAPDGTDLVLWRENTDVHLQVALHARIRLPGSDRWRAVPIGPKGTFLQDMAIAPTPSGDFWIAYQQGVSGPSQKVRLTRLDAARRTWSKPVTLFGSQTGYGHAGAAIARGGDGTLVVTAYAPPIDPPDGDPVYRVAVTVRRPGGAWQTRFLSPAGAFAAFHDVAANDAGDIVVAFVQGYDQADQQVRAATKGHRSADAWKLRPLSNAGDGYRPQAAIGDDGTAAVVWSASATAYDSIAMATIEVPRRLAPWVGRNVVAEAPYALEPHVVVDRHGDVTVVWRRGAGNTAVLWTRHLEGGTLSPAVSLTAADKLAAFAQTNPLTLRADGKVGLLYQLFTSTILGLGLRFRVLDHGVPGPVQEVTSTYDTDGDVNSASLGIDGHSRATVTYTRGTYPSTDFAWVDQGP